MYYEMSIAVPFILYWLLCLKFLKRNSDFTYLYRKTKSTFLIILIIWAFTIANRVQANLIELESVSVFLVYFNMYLKFILPTIAILLFVDYLFQGGIIVFAIPFLLLLANEEEAEKIFLKRLKSPISSYHKTWGYYFIMGCIIAVFLSISIVITYTLLLYLSFRP